VGHFEYGGSVDLHDVVAVSEADVIRDGVERHLRRNKNFGDVNFVKKCDRKIKHLFHLILGDVIDAIIGVTSMKSFGIVVKGTTCDIHVGILCFESEVFNFLFSNFSFK
jgi:hypothetical protein